MSSTVHPSDFSLGIPSTFHAEVDEQWMWMYIGRTVDGQFDRGIIHSNVVVVYKLGIHWYSIDPLNVIFPLRQSLDPMSSHLVFLQNLS